MSARVTLIEQRLRTALEPEHLAIADDSAAHAGHAGAREGGHFTVHIVSAAFAGKPRFSAIASLTRQSRT